MRSCYICYKPISGALFGHNWSEEEDVQPHVFCIECLTETWSNDSDRMRANVCPACTQPLALPEQFDKFMNVLSRGKLFTIQDFMEYFDDDDVTNGGLTDYQAHRLQIIDQTTTNINRIATEFALDKYRFKFRHLLIGIGIVLLLIIARMIYQCSSLELEDGLLFIKMRIAENVTVSPWQKDLEEIQKTIEILDKIPLK